ncbi:MAG: bifunctional riboflavin kinase/FAD synthetase [Legionellales bacterium]|nr:bifunctional riboflavin kinase/FAD synthetase [Legionellales bacterium]
MKFIRHSVVDPSLQKGTAAVIGNFDGVHRGHQALFKAVKDLAEQTGLCMLVIVFEPQTREFFLKENAPPRITPLRKKLQIFKQLGVDYVCCLRFGQRIAQMSAVEFAQLVIFSQLNVKHLFVGGDFRFGCDRLGDSVLLQSMALSYQAQVHVYPDVLLDDCKVSSTLVRQALQADDLNEAERLLGRPFSMCGRVIYGDAQARQWGIPTANIRLLHKPLPLHGVFSVRVVLQNEKTYQGVANMGCRPTLDGLKNLLEIHLFDFSGSLYGQHLEVFFLHKLRDEQKFSSKETLIAQIHADVAAAKAYFLGV